MITSDDVWWTLRQLRSSPPGLATRSGSRQKVFRAALEQSEQLFASAAVSALPTSPLLVFYGLSQAGRAILAAHSPGVNWAPRGHGIATKQGGRSLAELRVVQEDVGLFADIVRLTTSARLRESNFVRLWSAMCVIGPTLHDHDSNTPLVLQSEDLSFTISRTVTALLHGLPNSLLDHDRPLDAVEQWLGNYPTLRGWTLPPNLPVIRRDESRWTTRLTWTLDESLGGNHDRRQFVASNALRPTHGQEILWVPPSMEPGDGPLAPLVNWWALLYALSVLVRYEPANWAGLIDVDRSASAVALDRIMRLALDEVPRHLLQTLTNPTDWWSGPT